MPRASTVAALLVGSVVVALAVRAVDNAFRLVSAPRAADTPAALPIARPLALRLVDCGAIGIPTDTAAWGDDYSHNSKAFHRLILPSPPYVDEAEFRRLRTDWTVYLQRMAADGANGIVVPLFLELVTFERIPAIYAGTSFAERHRAVRDHFRELFTIARSTGLGIYLATDMAALTPPLERYLRRRGPLDPTEASLWTVYRSAFEEIFDELPEVDGAVIRIGEAGPLYSRAGWDYRSEFLVGSLAGLRAMLRGLLPVFESHARKLVLRSWSVGVGELGDLHTNPATYARAFDGIVSPSLVISTKFQAGDFFRFLPVNRTLLSGPQQRLIEFQARREFEGFTAFPNDLAALHASALASIRSANPAVIGSWLWTQNGGPLRAGPMSLYPLHGFWLWIDANVYVTARLAVEPERSPAELVRAWVQRVLTTDPTAVDAMTTLLLESPEPIERGLYIRPFAARRVTLGGLELPPLLWIMEWNIVGGWSSVWSIIYQVVKPDVEAAAADGFGALTAMDRMRSELELARPGLSARPVLVRQMERSLDYETSLLRTLAWYRLAALSYYRWLDTGNPAADRAWRRAASEFTRQARAHAAAFTGDLDFPPFRFSPAIEAFDRARQGSAARWAARAALGWIVLALVAGATGRWPTPGAEVARALWLGAVQPWRLGVERLSPGGLLAATAIVLATLLVGTGLALSFASPWAVAAVPGSLAIFSAVLVGLIGLRRGRRWTVAIMSGLGPLLWAGMLALAIMSVRGPGYLWYLAWSDRWTRAVLVATLAGAPLCALATGAWTVKQVTGWAPRAALGSVLLALGSALAVLALIGGGMERTLAALDQPLGLVPMTHAIVLGVATYTRLPRLAFWYPALIAWLALMGCVLVWRAYSRRRQA